jgi:Domain of unknown function (DUF4276)
MLVDGLSDESLGGHVAALAQRHGVILDVVTPEFDRMDDPPGRRVRDRLERVLGIDHDFNVLVVHRDAERASVRHRLDDIRRAAESVALAWPTVAVIPVRMTEAWLLLDETAIREVSGRPTGTDPLELPHPTRVEAHPDPKAALK